MCSLNSTFQHQADVVSPLSDFSNPQPLHERVIANGTFLCQVLSRMVPWPMSVCSIEQAEPALVCFSYETLI